MDTFFFVIYSFYSLHVWESLAWVDQLHNKRETMSKRPPLCTTGKIALAGKRNCERQLLDRKQRERDRRDLAAWQRRGGGGSAVVMPSVIAAAA